MLFVGLYFSLKELWLLCCVGPNKYGCALTCSFLRDNDVNGPIFFNWHILKVSTDISLSAVFLLLFLWDLSSKTLIFFLNVCHIYRVLYFISFCFWFPPSGGQFHSNFVWPVPIVVNYGFNAFKANDIFKIQIKRYWSSMSNGNNSVWERLLK